MLHPLILFSSKTGLLYSQYTDDMKILVVEDDHKIASIIARALQENGYAVDETDDGQEAVSVFTINEYDLILLDLLLPGIKGGGMEVCKQIRMMDTNIPILMLTALDAPQDKVKGLDAGADDYLVKPFHINELLARVRALLRRKPLADSTVLHIGDLYLDPAKRDVRRGENYIRLTTKEYALLEYLVKNAGRVVNQTELLEHVWDSNYQGMSNVVETYIRYLRKKLRKDGSPEIIETKRGSGYIVKANYV